MNIFLPVNLMVLYSIHKIMKCQLSMFSITDTYHKNTLNSKKFLSDFTLINLTINKRSTHTYCR